METRPFGKTRGSPFSCRRTPLLPEDGALPSEQETEPSRAGRLMRHPGRGGVRPASPPKRSGHRRERGAPEVPETVNSRLPSSVRGFWPSMTRNDSTIFLIVRLFFIRSHGVV